MEETEEKLLSPYKEENLGYLPFRYVVAIWIERNAWLFNGQSKNLDSIIDSVKVYVYN